MLFQDHEKAGDSDDEKGDSDAEEESSPFATVGNDLLLEFGEIVGEKKDQPAFRKLGGLEGKRAEGDPSLGAARLRADDGHQQQKQKDANEKIGSLPHVMLSTLHFNAAVTRLYITTTV